MTAKRILLILSLLSSLLFVMLAQGALPTAAQAPATKEISWEDLGLGRSLRIVGFASTQDVTIPVPAGLRPTPITARMRIPPSVAEGFLEVRSRNRLLTMIPFESTQDRQRVVIPLDEARVEDKNLPLTFVVRMRSPDDVCTGLYVGGWFELENPVVTFEGEWKAPRTVGTFFPRVLHQVFVVTPPQPTYNEAQTALLLSTAMSRNFRQFEGFRVQLLPMNDDGSLPEPEVPEPMFARMVVVQERPGENVIRVADSEIGAMPVLEVKGDGAGLQQQGQWLASQWEFSAQAHEITNLQFISTEEIGRSQVLLDDLQVPRWDVSGIGRMDIPVAFSQGDLGGPVQKIGIRIAFYYTPLQADAQATFSVYFNEALIYSTTVSDSLLQGDDYADLYVEVPKNLIQRDNTLVFSFVYTPVGGQCRIDAHPFTASIDRGSYLSVDYGMEDPLRFLHFPQVLIPNFQVAFSQLNFAQLEAAVTTVGELQRLTQTPITPNVMDWQEALEEKEKLPTLLISHDPEDLKALDAPVLLEPFRVLGPEGNVLLTFSTETPFGVAEALTYEGRRLLLMAVQPGLPIEELAYAIVDQPNGWYDLRGDAFIYTAEGGITMLQVHEGGIEIEPLRETTVSWFQRWQGLLYPLLLIAVLALGAWLYPRLVRTRMATPSQQNADVEETPDESSAGDDVA